MGTGSTVHDDAVCPVEDLSIRDGEACPHQGMIA